MTTNDELDSILWDYVYGLLSPDDARALEERITSEHDVARAYAEVRQRADLLGAAARVTAKPLALTLPDAPLASGQRDLSRTLPWLLSGAAVALIALLGYTSLRHGWLHSPQLVAQAEQALAAEHKRLIVTGPVEVRPELTNLYSVQLQDLNGDAVAHEEFGFALINDREQVVQQAMVATDEAGQGIVAIDGTKLESAGTLKLWCAASKAAAEVQLSLARVEPALATYWTTDKPTYQPGETMYFRALTLPPLATHWHDQSTFNYQAVAPSGETVGEPIVGLTNQGVGNGAIRLPETAPAGRYGLLAQTAGAIVPLQQLREGLSTNDAAPSPANVRLNFFPEGGGLVAGLDNNVFFAAVDAANAPVELRGEIVDQRQQKVAEIATTYAGRGVFTLKPRPDETYWFKPAAGVAWDKAATTPLAATASHAQLKTPQPVLPAGDALEVEVTTTKTPAQFLVAASRLGATIGQQFVDFDVSPTTGDAATQEVRIPLAEEANGVFDVTLYDCAASPPQPLAHRFAYRAPDRYWTIQLSPDASSSPSQAVWNLRVADERGRAGRALLGVSVVTTDEAATTPPTIAAGNDLPALSTELAVRMQNTSEHDAGTDALGLLLGTLSTSSPPTSLAYGRPKANGELGGGTLAGESTFGVQALGDATAQLQAHPPSAAMSSAKPPALVDNLAEVQVGYEQAVLAWRAQQEARVQTFALVIAIGGLTLLLACAISLVLRLAGQWGTWLPALGGALALVIASLWLGARIDRPVQVAVQPIAHYHDAPTVSVTTTALARNADSEATDSPLAPLPIQRFRYDTFKEQSEQPATGPTTLLWDPLLSTNDHGEAQLHFALPQPTPRYRIRIDAHGSGRLGSLEHLVDAPPLALPAPAPE